MKLIISTDLRDAAKSALEIVEANSIRSFGTVAHIKVSGSNAELVATDGFRLLIYPIRMCEPAIEATSFQVNHETLKALSKIKDTLMPVTVDMVEGMLTIGGRLAQQQFRLSQVKFPAYESVIRPTSFDSSNEVYLNPFYVDLGSIFPKRTKQVQMIRLGDGLIEFVAKDFVSERDVRYFVVGMKVEKEEKAKVKA